MNYQSRYSEEESLDFFVAPGSDNHRVLSLRWTVLFSSIATAFVLVHPSSVYLTAHIVLTGVFLWLNLSPVGMKGVGLNLSNVITGFYGLWAFLTAILLVLTAVF
ncbi:hypothetical protein BCR33DRAFT_790247 [Rhizoclosmatium globosum]|uniref:Uncharacterized protein n=1 Tax=Rhizoclosmatium globosum TaxID=329046 RepID=A0A1Y2BNZ9_9FUNG|nr:hypothetical protein HDU79_002244 [Rhizoclosmatium sp. JEL0117]ORY36469.1 hypothetical protein BCR33DRAFT_790247 [Rhizoclosmatium globosum]|eukprot:ORY36469.1 hypothetical protein BCR33DRAFT_790247 [Rhizoclosmatium globosum]